MVRITTRIAEHEIAFTVEGCLSGPPVHEFEACWRKVVAETPGQPVRVDLTAVCHADAAGRELLAKMHRAGARFTTRGCVMPEVIREISREAACRG
jgi:anti-anti-sigma regulatory factor